MRETIMSADENKAIVGRWFTEFWGKDFNPAVIDELAPDIRFEYSLHEALRGRDSVRAFAEKFRAAFPDLNFWGTADLIAAPTPGTAPACGCDWRASRRTWRRFRLPTAERRRTSSAATTRASRVDAIVTGVGARPKPCRWHVGVRSRDPRRARKRGSRRLP
jgi:hypothetical protein